MTRLLSTLAVLAAALPAAAADPIKVLIIDGQNNHNWKATTPILKAILGDAKLFAVDVATAPANPGGKAPDEAKAAYREKMAAFKPDFAKYAVVVSNYNGDAWPAATQAAFGEFVGKGGGFVPVHAANNAFPEWPEYNAMIGVGGWGGRNEKAGPYVRVRDGKTVLDMSKGAGGSHGRQHEFVVETREADHPVLKDLPAKWLHATDELYDRLRGPAKNLIVLATAYADPKTGGSGHHEPMLMTIQYGEGRVFHTTLGHSEVSMRCVGFRTTFARGVEWAATGKVTQPVPKDFPTAEKASVRP
jgi:type 1 glutamine amidotransferase